MITGKAGAQGTALVSGNWAAQSSEGPVLVGELGYEIVVRNGRFFTVGNYGAEMFPIKRVRQAAIHFHIDADRAFHVRPVDVL